MNEEQSRYHRLSVGIDYWESMDEGTTIHYEQGAPRRSTMMPQRWEVISGMLKPTDNLSPKKKRITHKMSMT